MPTTDDEFISISVNDVRRARNVRRYQTGGYQTKAGQEDPLITRASRLQNRITDQPLTTTTGDVTLPHKTAPIEKAQKPDIPKHQRWPFVFVGMAIMLCVIVSVQLAFNGLSGIVDNVRYGMPRTYQTDAFVGQETGKTPSHFIALNYEGRIEVIEFPGGKTTTSRIFLGPQLSGSNASLEPVTLSFVDTNHNHHPDMIVQTPNIQITFKNTGVTFVPEQ